MCQNPLITIIVPIYNVEKYLKRCLNSIINQTYKNLQIILVDDGSIDKCGNICDEYQKKDERIEVIHKKNGGLSEARNDGILKARGEYIGFVDGDDYISENMYYNMCKHILDTNSDVCICNFYNVKNNNEFIKNEHSGEIKTYNKHEILEKILIDKEIQSYAWNKLYKKELFYNVKYPKGKMYEDIETTFFLLEKCEKIVVTDEPEYYYIDRDDSIVKNIKEQTIIDYIDIISERYDYIEKKYRNLKRYNNYYLIRTLITAYNDIFYLKNISENLRKKIENLHEKVNNLLEENESDIISLFDLKQKVQLYTILYDKKMFSIIKKEMFDN